MLTASKDYLEVLVDLLVKVVQDFILDAGLEGLKEVGFDYGHGVPLVVGIEESTNSFVDEWLDSEIFPALSKLNDP